MRGGVGQEKKGNRVGKNGKMSREECKLQSVGLSAKSRGNVGAGEKDVQGPQKKGLKKSEKVYRGLRSIILRGSAQGGESTRIVGEVERGGEFEATKPGRQIGEMAAQGLIETIMSPLCCRGDYRNREGHLG